MSQQKMNQLKILQTQTEILKSEIEHEQRVCQHSWTETKYDPEAYTEFYNTNEVAGCGSDWYYKTATREAYRDRWSRYCPKCGKKEYTSSTETLTQKKPVFK